MFKLEVTGLVVPADEITPVPQEEGAKKSPGAAA